MNIKKPGKEDGDITIKRPYDAFDCDWYVKTQDNVFTKVSYRRIKKKADTYQGIYSINHVFVKSVDSNEEKDGKFRFRKFGDNKENSEYIVGTII